MATENTEATETTETLPPTYQWSFCPRLTEFVAEDRLLTSSGGVGGTKVPGDGWGSVIPWLKSKQDRNLPDVLPAVLKRAGRPFLLAASNTTTQVTGSA
jgi:hypothetical protein